MTGPTALSPGELSRAREAAYELLTGIIHGPLTAALHEAMGLEPRLHPERAFDELAVDQYAAFQAGAFPRASLFLDPSGASGGALSAALADRWTGLRVPTHGREPDELGAHLLALAWLCGAESDAWADGQATEAARLRALQREVLDATLLPWLPAWAASIPTAWGAAAGHVLADLVGHHAKAVGAGPGAAALPTIDPLDPAARATDLRAIAEHLCTPVQCGFLLTSDTVREIGHALELPGGFGPRTQRLTNMLRSAARFGAWDRLMRALDAHAERVGAALDRSPWRELGVSAAWIARIGQTRATLGRIAAHAVTEG